MKKLISLLIALSPLIVNAQYRKATLTSVFPQPLLCPIQACAGNDNAITYRALCEELNQLYPIEHRAVLPVLKMNVGGRECVCWCDEAAIQRAGG